MYVLCIPAVIVNFDQTVYSVNENNGPAQTMLILNNPSVFDITLQIVSNGLSGMVYTCIVSQARPLFCFLFVGQGKMTRMVWCLTHRDFFSVKTTVIISCFVFVTLQS